MGWNNWTDEPTTEFTDSELEEHDAEVRAEERKKAELDFQNGEYWNDCLSKVLADERENLLKEICSKERIMIDIDDDGKAHFVVKAVDIMKAFNKEQKNNG